MRAPPKTRATRSAVTAAPSPRGKVPSRRTGAPGGPAAAVAQQLVEKTNGKQEGNVAVSAEGNTGPVVVSSSVVPPVPKGKRSSDNNCAYCDKYFARKQVRKKHEITVHESPAAWSCQRAGCNKTFSQKSHRDLHERRVHDDLRPFPCAECTSRFHDRQQLNLHKRTVHDKRRDFKCSVENCGKTYTDPRHLRRHVKVFHQKRLDYACEMCPSKFGTRHTKDRHVKIIHSQKRQQVDREAASGSAATPPVRTV